MSVAYDLSAVEFPFEQILPDDVLPDIGTPGRLASISVLHAPSESARPSLRLTARGRAVLALLLAVTAAAFVWTAMSSAPASGPTTVVGPASVTVQPGDTLWSIASRAAPQTDPRSEIALLQARNHLSGVDLVPGQVLHVR